MSINHVALSGNLTRDPELRRAASGTAILAFSIAVNDRRKNQQTGEWEDYPNFIDCTMFGRRAESLHQHLAKGAKVTLEGKLHWSQWERDGRRHSKIEVVVGEIEFIGRNASGGGANGRQQSRTASAQGYSVDDHFAAIPSRITPSTTTPYDEDIPF